MTKTKRTQQEMLDVELARYNKLMEEANKLKTSISDRKKNLERKRLNEIGKTVEDVLGCEIKKEDLPKLKEFLENADKRGISFSKFMGVDEIKDSDTQKNIKPQTTNLNHPTKQSPVSSFNKNTEPPF
jgi:GTP1/Obg family GTP-binding protein